MFCGLEKISEDKYKCYRYSLIGKYDFSEWGGVQKKDRDEYVIVSEGKAKKIKRIIVSFNTLLYFLLFAGGYKSYNGALLDSIFPNIFWFWFAGLVLTFAITPIYLSRMYDKIFDKKDH